MADYFFNFFKQNSVKRFFIFVLIAFCLYLLRSMMNLILLTFIFTFLMDQLTQTVHRFVPINRKIIVVVLYIAIVGLLAFGCIRYLPIIISEISQLVKQLTDFYTHKQTSNVFFTYLIDYAKQHQISDYLKQGVTFILGYFTEISKFSLQVILSILLSLFYLLEKNRLVAFTNKFKHSKLAVFYEEIAFFSTKLVWTFGKVIEAQFIIAIVNAVLTVIALWILHFPQLFGLGIMIFFLGLIPVAGVIISLVPLSIVAYSMNGFTQVIYVLIIILVVHSIETYILNPKLMSSKTNLPIFYTFVVLLFSEHFFGVWGLILGLPIFVFLLDVLGVMEAPHAVHKKRE